jgi:hypothetical protein
VTERKPLVSYGFFVSGAAGAGIGLAESVVVIGLAESVAGFGAIESGFTVESTGVAGIDWVALAGLVLSITGWSAGLLQAASATVASAAAPRRRERMVILISPSWRFDYA